VLACGCNSDCGRGWRLSFWVDIGRFREKEGGGGQRERERKKVKSSVRNNRSKSHVTIPYTSTRFLRQHYISVKEENGRNLRMQPCRGPIPSPGFQEGGIVTALFCIWLGIRRGAISRPKHSGWPLGHCTDGIERVASFT